MKSKLPSFPFHSDYFRLVSLLIFTVAGIMGGFFLPLRISLAIRYDFFLPAVLIFILLWAAWRLPDPWGEGLSLLFTALLFSASLTVLWRTGNHGIYQVFGMLPWFDAQGYYSEALRLLDGGFFTQISARRPIFPGFFSFLLFITNRNLRDSLMIITSISATSTWLLAKEIKITGNKAVIPAGITTLLFLYYRNFNGAVLTETIGYPLGCIGIVLLWNAASSRKLFPALCGLLCMTLALSARPGAVFSLPLLVLWIVFCLKSGDGIWRKLLSSSAVLVLGILVNSLLTGILAPGISASYSNFAQTFYGLVNGGVGWQAVYRDHPEFFVSGNEGLASQQIYKVALQTLFSHPEKTLSGGFHSIQAFFSAKGNSAFNFLGSENSPVEPSIQNGILEFFGRWLANILLMLVLPIGIFVRKNPRWTLLLAINLGILFSLPFAPPGDAEKTRVYAASITGMVIAVIMVIQFLFNKGKDNISVLGSAPKFVYSLAGVLVILLSAGAILMHLIARPPEMPSLICPNNEDRLVTRISAGSTISIGNNPADPFAIPYSRFSSNLPQFPDAKVGEALTNVTENSIISQQNDASQGGNMVWLVYPTGIQPEKDTLSVFCGHWSKDPALKFVFFADQVIY
jgi:hypothetical protein